MGGTIAIAMVLVVIVLVLVNQGVRVVQPHQRIVLFRLGRADASSVRGPGLAFLIPIIDRGVLVDMREQSITVVSRAVTRDNTTVRVELDLSWKITDPFKSVINVANFHGAFEVVAERTVREVIGNRSLDEVESRRDQVLEQVRGALDPIADRWGAQVTRLEMGEMTRAAPASS